MYVNSFLAAFSLGFLGAFLADFIGWYKLRRLKPEELPKYLSSFFYWIISFAMWIVGGILVILYGTSNVNAILALNIGASAPLIIGRFASIIPPIK